VLITDTANTFVGDMFVTQNCTW